MSHQRFHIGDTFDVWWEIIAIKYHRPHEPVYTLRNKANGMTIILKKRCLIGIAEGRSSVSAKICNKMRIAKGANPRQLVPVMHWKGERK